MALGNGTNVKVDYIGSLEDGTIFDSSVARGEPLEFAIGAGQVIPGFEDAIVDMEKGQTKKMKISAEKAYGIHNQELIQNYKKADIPENAKEGMVMIAELDGQVQIPVTIVTVGEDNVIVDLNHPLAGKDLRFEITLIEVG